MFDPLLQGGSAMSDDEKPAKIFALPSASPKTARKLAEHAQDIKDTDPGRAVELQEEAIRILVKEIKKRNEMIKGLRRVLLDYLPDDNSDT